MAWSHYFPPSMNGVSLMLRRAMPPTASTLRSDEATGTRSKESVSDLPRVSPCAMARRLLEDGRAEDAIQLLESEIESGEENADLLFWLGRAAFQLGDHVRAQRALFAASAMSPDDAEARRWLARVLLRRGNPLGAMRVLRRVSDSSIPPPNSTSHIIIQRYPSSVPPPEDDSDVESDESPTSQWRRSSHH